MAEVFEIKEMEGLQKLFIGLIIVLQVLGFVFSAIFVGHI